MLTLTQIITSWAPLARLCALPTKTAKSFYKTFASCLELTNMRYKQSQTAKFDSLPLNKDNNKN